MPTSTPKGISDKLFSSKAFYDLPAADKRIAQNAVEAFLDTLFSSAKDDAEVANILDALAAHIDGFGDNVFHHVNPARRRNYDFEAALSSEWEKTKNVNAIHLELGTWTSWPASRADQFVRDEQLGDVIRLDFEVSHRPDVAASATALPFADNSIDRVSSNSLLEHVAYPHDILREVLRVLRPGGVMYSAVPFHFVQHSCPRDYLRFTGHFFEDVAADIGFANVHVDTTSTSGLYATLHTLAKSALVDEWNPNEQVKRTARVVQTSVIGALAALAPLDDYIVAGGASHWHSTMFFGTKPGTYKPSSRPIDRGRAFVERQLPILACPRTLEPLLLDGERLISKSRRNTYPLEQGTPNLVVMHGKYSQPALAKENAELRLELARRSSSGRKI